MSILLPPGVPSTLREVLPIELSAPTTEADARGAMFDTSLLICSVPRTQAAVMPLKARVATS